MALYSPIILCVLSLSAIAALSVRQVKSGKVQACSRRAGLRTVPSLTLLHVWDMLLIGGRDALLHTTYVMLAIAGNLRLGVAFPAVRRTAKPSSMHAIHQMLACSFSKIKPAGGWLSSS
eukprot:1877885-Amphidinium_carterae.1